MQQESPPPPFCDADAPMHGAVRLEKTVLHWLLGGMSLLVLLSIVGVLGIYAYQFHGALMPDAKDWGPFGDYVGGLLNPILAFCSFSAILVTVYLQAKSLDSAALSLVTAESELKLARQSAADETQRRATEALKQDLLEMFRTLNAEIEEVFTRPTDFAPGKKMGDFLSDSALEQHSAFPAKLPHTLSKNDLRAVKDLIRCMHQLNTFLNEYTRVIGPNAVTYYYASRFMLCAYVMVDKGYLENYVAGAFYRPEFKSERPIDDLDEWPIFGL